MPDGLAIGVATRSGVTRHGGIFRRASVIAGLGVVMGQQRRELLEATGGDLLVRRALAMQLTPLPDQASRGRRPAPERS